MDLTLDRVWDPHRVLDAVFPVRGAHHENILRAGLDLGAFVCRPGDTLALFNDWDDGFQEYFRATFGFLPEFCLLKAPADLLKKRFADYLFAGVGPLEQELRAPGQSHPSAAWYSARNAKTWLARNAQGFAFPRTEVVPTAGLREAITDRTPVIVKAEFGSGGRGVFRIEDPRTPFLNHLERAASGTPGLNWLVQELVARDEDFYTICEGANILGQWKIDYDGANNSWRHAGVTTPPSAAVRAAAEVLAEKLAAEGYAGPFGFDGLKSGAQVYPAIDLNVRYDKSRLLLEAIHRLGRDPRRTEIQRLRITTAERGDFRTWWSRITADLGLDSAGKRGDDLFMSPLSISSLFSKNPPPFDERRPAELLIACSADATWSGRVRAAVEKSL